MAILRLRLVDEAPRDGQAVQPVHIEGLEGGGAPTLTAVEVETLAAGSDATASIEGTTLRIGIPAGDKGDPGAPGADGADGAKGDKGDPGAPGAAGVGVAAIALVTDAEGKVTGGTWTDTASSPHDIAVTASEAQ